MRALASGLRASAFGLALAAGVPGERALAGDEAPVVFEKPDATTRDRISDQVSLFGSNSPDDRERARDTLGEIGYWSIRPLLDTLGEKGNRGANIRSNAILALARLEEKVGGGRSLPALRATVASDAAENPAAFAALMLGRLRDPEALPVLGQTLADRKRDFLKTCAVVAMGKFARVREDDAGALLESVVDARGRSSSQREAAMLALGLYPKRVAVVSADGANEAPARRFLDGLDDRSSPGMRLSSVLALAMSRRDGFHDTFVRVYREDPDREVKRAALLALGFRRDDATTDLLADALENAVGVEIRRMAAYLLTVRKDPRSVQTLLAVATSPRASELAGAAVVALGGIPEDRAVTAVFQKLNDRNATVRGAAAMACTRFPRGPDLAEALRRLNDRLKGNGEPDQSVSIDMQLARRIIQRELDNRQREAGGLPREPAVPEAWAEPDGADLLRLLGRTEREALLELVSLRILQVLGIEGLGDYTNDRMPKTGPLPPESDRSRTKREHAIHSDERDQVREFSRRPYYTLDDLPEWRPQPVPREGR